MSRQLTLYELVLNKIGPNYERIDIHPLWENRYRVNVWADVKLDNQGRGRGFYEVKDNTDFIHEKRIVKSFFIRYKDGVISYCNPPLN